jgi:O-antigen/teichoic acid export membrane protein
MQGITQIGQPIGLGLQAFIASNLIKKYKKNHKAILRYGFEVSLIVFLSNILLSLPLSRLFSIDYLVLVLTIGAVSPFVFLSTQLGIAQGKELFRKLALIYVIFGLGRSVSAIICLISYPKLISVGIGFFVGTILSAVICHFVLGEGVKFWKNKRLKESSIGFVKSTHILLALYLLVNVDILIARITLSPENSGVYAVGLLVAKIAFFMPQAFTVVLFPRMGENDISALFYAFNATLMLGIFYVLFSFFAADIFVTAIGGNRYIELYSEVWLFAIEGLFFALLQVLLYSRIASEDPKAASILWVGTLVVVFIIWIFKFNSISEIVYTLIGVTFVLIVIFASIEVLFRKKYSSYNKLK